MYLYTGRGGFKVMERKEVERQAQARPNVRAEGIRVAIPRSQGRKCIDDLEKLDFTHARPAGCSDAQTHD